MRLLIVQTGSTSSAEVKAAAGDYDRMFMAALGLAAQEVAVARVHLGESLPLPDQVAGIVVTGSPAMVTNREPWSERTAAWLKGAAAAERPILGVCYGHQLLAHALGGEVGANQRGPNYGLDRVLPSEAATADPLFRVIGEGGEAVFEAHYQSPSRLPARAEMMARNASDPHQGLRFGRTVWGVQFHPEFTVPVMSAILDNEREDLEKAGLDVTARKDALDAGAEAFGRKLLRRFREICGI